MLGVDFDDLHRGGWDPDARLPEQDRDGVSRRDHLPDRRHGAVQPRRPRLQARLHGRLQPLDRRVLRRPIPTGCSASARPPCAPRRRASPTSSRIARPRAQGRDDAGRSPAWRTTTPPSTTTSTTPPSTSACRCRSTSSPARRARCAGPKINGFLTIVRSCQDVMGTLVFGAVFERHPDLKVVCAEADAGWVPHYAYRMDHAYDRHRNWMPHGDLSSKPSEYFNENIYVTFQDDWVAFKVAHLMNVERLLWANDFPHSDSTWPWSQDDAGRAHRPPVATATSSASCTTTWPTSTACPPPRRGALMFDVKIEGGTVIDGTGTAASWATWASTDGKVVGHRAGRRRPQRPERRRRHHRHRRRRSDRGPRLRRHPHPLRRPDPVGPHAHRVAVARGDHRRHRQLRLRRGADPARRTATSSSAPSRRSRA